MEQNAIYCFTGTGNSLRAAHDIARRLENCKVLPMTAGQAPAPRAGDSRVGFVFPVYFGGLPHGVEAFLDGLDLSQNQSAYLFAVATYGGFAAGAVGEVDRRLRAKGAALEYGHNIKMASNYLLMYDMQSKEELAKLEEPYQAAISTISQAVAAKGKSAIRRASALMRCYHDKVLRGVAASDAKMTVSSACVGCGLCSRVCPAQNIDMTEGKPVFLHRCEQCMACLQYCPKRALDWGNKTQGRGRYCSGGISLEERVAFYALCAEGKNMI